MRKIHLTESDLEKIIQKIILESEETMIEGPFVEKGKQYPLYYIYKKNGRFYIYFTDDNSKEPYLPTDGSFTNNGKGYTSISETKSVLKSIIRQYSEKPTNSKPVGITEGKLSNKLVTLLQTKINEILFEIKNDPEKYDDSDSFFDAAESIMDIKIVSYEPKDGYMYVDIYKNSWKVSYGYIIYLIRTELTRLVPIKQIVVNDVIDQRTSGPGIDW